jgi:ArsR family transcriptional regulator
MEPDARLSPHAMLDALKAAADPTRLRLLALLAGGELNVSDLTTILGQSQPRVSRHLKILAAAGLIERFRDGSWVFLSLAGGGEAEHLVRTILAGMDASAGDFSRDRSRASKLAATREAAAQAYFAAHAAEWDCIRALHVAEAEVEAAILKVLGPGPFDLLVDLGTGTGRMLELLAPRYKRGLGFDINAAMLAYARSRLSAAKLDHAQIKHGNLRDLRVPDGCASVIVMHQVLHFLTDPGAAIREAARILAPDGRLLIVDFAPHGLEFLRASAAHVRLGFSDAQIETWLSECGLHVTETDRLTPKRSGKSAEETLTVNVWLGMPRPATRGRALRRSRNLEETSS